jgi:HAD superfamily hydrolase (TIGR01549 family)
MKLPDGFTRERFPRSFASTSATLDIMSNKPIDAEAMENAKKEANKVFDAEYLLFPDSRKVLFQLQTLGKRLFLLTKGDIEVQSSKIEKNGLNKFFPTPNIYIVNKKTATSIETIVGQHELNKAKTIMVGDSEHDDIKSASEAGIFSYHITRGETPAQKSEIANWSFPTLEHLLTIP